MSDSLILVLTPRDDCGPAQGQLWSVRRFRSLKVPRRNIPNPDKSSLRMFSSPILQQALGQGPSYVETNPYRAKRLWPPDFKTLSPKEQFKLERRYRRRSKLAWARPKWTKFTKIAQLGTISCEYYRATKKVHALTRLVVVVWGVLFADWQQENEPFQAVRITKPLFHLKNADIA